MGSAQLQRLRSSARTALATVILVTGVVALAAHSLAQAAIVPPGAVDPAARGPREIRVYWTGAPSAVRHEVLRDGAVVASVAAPADVYIDPDVAPGQAYRYAVAAVDAGGRRVVSAPVTERAYPDAPREVRCDLLVVGGNAAGVSAAVVAARYGLDVVLTEETRRLGGMCANGLGASDIRRGDHASGFFEEFRQRVRAIYGEGDGLHYEPRVAQQAIKSLMWAEERLRVYREFRPVAVGRAGSVVDSVTMEDASGRRVTFHARMVVDATECGDVAARAGAVYRVGREPRTPREPHAGHILYDRAGARLLPASTGRADTRLQAYAYLMTVKDYGPGADRTIARPPGYDPAKYEHAPRWERSWAVTSGWLPGRKFEINQHPQGSDLQEANYRYPRASYAERRRIERMYRDHALGYLYYIQTVEGRRNIGLSADDYRDSDGWPMLLYVREARRFTSDVVMDEQDIAGARGLVRPDAIGIADYALDSHATQVKRDWSTPDMGEGEFYLPQITPWHQVPFRIMAPPALDNVFVPTAVSATHVAYGTYRLEPVRMHFGSAAGIAAALCIRHGLAARDAPVRQIQLELLKSRPAGEAGRAALGVGGAGALAAPTLLYLFPDMRPGAPQYREVQWLAARGLYPCPAPEKRTPTAMLAAAPFRPGDAVTPDEAKRAIAWLAERRIGAGEAPIAPVSVPPGGVITRGDAAVLLCGAMGWTRGAAAPRYVDTDAATPSANAAEALRERWIDSVLWDGAGALEPGGGLRFRPAAPVTRVQWAQMIYLAQLHIGPVWADHPLDRLPALTVSP